MEPEQGRHDNGWCIRTAVGKAWECFWTPTLDDGQITVKGPFLDGSDSVLAVTGGTGAYSGVRGEMTPHPRNPEGTECFRYRLMRSGATSRASLGKEYQRGHTDVRCGGPNSSRCSRH